METKARRASLAYKGLRDIPREFLKRLQEMQVDELDLSHNELTYPFCCQTTSGLHFPLCVDKYIFCARFYDKNFRAGFHGGDITFTIYLFSGR